MKFFCWATAATAVFSVLMSSAAAPSADVSPAAVLPAAVPSIDASPAAASPDGGGLSAQQVYTSVAQLTVMSSELRGTVQTVNILNALFIAPVGLFRIRDLSVYSEIHSDHFTAENCSRPHRHCHFLSGTSRSPSMPRSKCLRRIFPLNVAIDM